MWSDTYAGDYVIAVCGFIIVPYDDERILKPVMSSLRLSNRALGEVTLLGRQAWIRELRAMDGACSNCLLRRRAWWAVGSRLGPDVR